jgi:segregation and condensation protein B
VQRIESEESQVAEASPSDWIELDQAVSLEELSAAYARLLGPAADGEVEVDDRDLTEEDPKVASLVMAGKTSPPSESLPRDREHDGVPVSARAILEAILFVGNADNRALSSVEIAGWMRDVLPSEIDDLVVELNRLYAEDQHVMRLVASDGGYRLQLGEPFEGLRGVLTGRVRETQLNQAAVDCLSLVAYQPGATREEIEKLWGKPASSVLGLLVRRELLRLERAGQGKGASSRYYPTEKFLNLVGIESLADLPVAESDL